MPDIMIKGPDGSFSGYLAVPDAASGPGVVLIQEIFGVNQVMRDRADDLAATLAGDEQELERRPGGQIHSGSVIESLPDDLDLGSGQNTVARDLAFRPDPRRRVGIDQLLVDGEVEVIGVGPGSAANG